MPEIRVPSSALPRSVEADFAAPEDGTRMEIPVARPPVEQEEAPSSSGFAGPDAMTMMEIRIPSSAKPEPEAADYAGPEDGTRMEIPVARPPAEEAPSSPEFAEIDDRVMPEPAQADMERTMPEIRVPQPQSSHYPQEENFTMMEMEAPKQWQSQGDNFTMMEMETPKRHPIPDPFESEGFTQLQVKAPEQQTMFDLRSPIRSGGRGRLLMVAFIVLIVLAVIVVALVVMSGNFRFS
jgi:hypothetical protein